MSRAPIFQTRDAPSYSRCSRVIHNAAVRYGSGFAASVSTFQLRRACAFLAAPAPATPP
ncbi:MAG: hypothetical protein LBT53_02605 [Puniceicoccales bacterium]|nr:hypothetical protein [Puniceicoccales bacterium]